MAECSLLEWWESTGEPRSEPAVQKGYLPVSYSSFGLLGRDLLCYLCKCGIISLRKAWAATTWGCQQKPHWHRQHLYINKQLKTQTQLMSKNSSVCLILVMALALEITEIMLLKHQLKQDIAASMLELLSVWKCQKTLYSEHKLQV